MGSSCVTPKFKKSHKASSLGNREYNVTIPRGKGRGTARRKVKILCSGKWKFLKK